MSGFAFSEILIRNPNENDIVIKNDNNIGQLKTTQITKTNSEARLNDIQLIIFTAKNGFEKKDNM